MPVDNLGVLKEFSEKYNNGDTSIKIKGIESLRIEPKWNETYKPHLEVTRVRPGVVKTHSKITNSEHIFWFQIGS